MKRIPTVGLIDDDKIYQLTSARIIRSVLEVDTLLQFNDGEEAMDYLLRHRSTPSVWPDLIFLDLNMPYMDGWQFLDEFTRHGLEGVKSVTIYILTSSASGFDMERAKSYQHISGYLVKPMMRKEYLRLFEDIA
jgi:two-component system chemotaxis response regulator CheY